MKRIMTLSAAVTFLFAAVSTQAQRNFDSVEIQTVKVADHIYMLVGQGGNIGVSVGEDGALIIDDQFAPLAGKIKTAVDALGSGGLQFLLNTHWHGDHTGSNPLFGKTANIIAHTNVRKRLSTEQTARGQTTPPMEKDGLPVVTFDESLSIHFNGEEIKMVHFPHGHTDGDSVVFFMGSNVVHMGDHFFKDRFPYVDVGSGGNPESYARNVGQIIKLLSADVKIIPGHGPLADLDDLKAFHAMLTETIAIVKKQVDEGKCLADIQKAGLPAKYNSWGEGFINANVWMQTLHTSLTQ